MRNAKRVEGAGLEFRGLESRGWERRDETPMSRKDRIAPFEVMRSGREQRERAQATTEPVAEKPIPEESGNQEQAQPAVFEPTSSGPLVLRIPKGYAALAALILVGLFVLTYWVGYARGDNSSKRPVS